MFWNVLDAVVTSGHPGAYYRLLAFERFSVQPIRASHPEIWVMNFGPWCQIAANNIWIWRIIFYVSRLVSRNLNQLKRAIEALMFEKKYVIYRALTRMFDLLFKEKIDHSIVVLPWESWANMVYLQFVSARLQA